MVSHTTIPSFEFRLNNPNMGTVVFVVEGVEMEFRILERIFSMLGYERIRPRVRNPALLILGSELRPNNQIIVVRAENSSIKNIKDFDDYFDETYSSFFLNNNIDIRYAPIYYIWDRDPGSNPADYMKELFKLMNSARHDDNYMNGLLLVSYPCVESYLISCNEEIAFLPDGVGPKQYAGIHRLKPNRLGEENVIHGAIMMLKSMLELGISSDSLNFDDFSGVNRMIFDQEEEIRVEKSGNYKILSLLSVALLDLGIIVMDRCIT